MKQIERERERERGSERERERERDRTREKPAGRHGETAQRDAQDSESHAKTVPAGKKLLAASALLELLSFFVTNLSFTVQLNLTASVYPKRREHLTPFFLASLALACASPEPFQAYTPELYRAAGCPRHVATY